MQELRFAAVSEDGRYAVLAVPGRSARFTLPIDERLRAVALGQTSRLAQYEIEVESPLRPKEIQARIRAGETVEEIADAAGVAVERVRWFEGPVLAERAYIAEQAQSAAVRRQGEAIPSSPAPRLGEIVADRLRAFGADRDDAQWDAKKLGDGSWQVQLTFISGGRLHVAEWIFDPRRRHVLPADDNAARMSLPGAEPPVPAAPPPGEATVTRLAPRLSTAAGHGAPVPGTPGYGPALGNSGMGNGGVGNGGMGNGGRARHERPGAGRPAVPEPRTHEPGQTEAPAAAHSASSAPPADRAATPARAARVPQAPEPGRADPGRETRPGQGTPPGQGGQAGPPPRGGALPPPGAVPQAARDARSGQESPGAHARPEPPAAIASPGRGEPTAPAGPGPAAASPAEAVTGAPARPAEAGSEQVGRPGRKAARGRRSSVPSWDEIMFGNSRQQD